MVESTNLKGMIKLPTDKKYWGNNKLVMRTLIKQSGTGKFNLIYSGLPFFTGADLTVTRTKLGDNEKIASSLEYR